MSVTNGTVSTSQTSNFGSVTATNAQIAVGAGDYRFESFAGENKSIVFTDLKNTTKVNVLKKTGKAQLVVTSEVSDKYETGLKAAESLAAVYAETGKDPQTQIQVLVEASNTIGDKVTATLGQDGLEDVRIFKNDRMVAMGSFATLSALTLRHEMNSVTKRMGELRDSPTGVGVWARAYGSEMEYGAQSVTMKSNSLQIGSDYAVGDWKIGAALTYINGDTTYVLGSGETEGYGLAVYGTWFVPCGAYVDLMVKYNRLDNDFALNGMKGSYKNDAFGLIVETGYRFEFLNGCAFVEPQLGLNYGWVKGDTFRTDNSVTISQDDYDSLIGRLGVRTGFKFPKDKGMVYVRVSGVYDFQGKFSATALTETSCNTAEADLSGAWVETGIGANCNWSKNTYTYIDLERTNGGEVKENYRWNVGLRHVF